MANNEKEVANVRILQQADNNNTESTFSNNSASCGDIPTSLVNDA